MKQILVGLGLVLSANAFAKLDVAAYGKATSILKSSGQERLYQEFQAKGCAPFKLSDLKNGGAQLAKTVGADLTYNRQGTKTLACQAIESGKAARSAGPSSGNSKLGSSAGDVWLKKIIGSHCSASIDIRSFGPDFLAAWANAAGKTVTFVDPRTRKAHWTAGGKAVGGPDPSGESHYTSCVPKNAPVASGTSLSYFTAQCRADSICRSRMQLLPAYKNSMRAFAKQCRANGAKIELTDATGRQMVGMAGSVGKVIWSGFEKIGDVLLQESQKQYDPFSALDEPQTTESDLHLAEALAVAISYNASNSYRCLIPAAKGCPKDVIEGRKTMANWLHAVNAIKYKKYEYYNGGLDALPPMYFWCSEESLANKAADGTKKGIMEVQKKGVGRHAVNECAKAGGIIDDKNSVPNHIRCMIEKPKEEHRYSVKDCKILDNQIGTEATVQMIGGKKYCRVNGFTSIYFYSRMP
ncbi:MAG: hypothetical protein JNL01_03570 [Bdellovibrionales bacterium]|nr:hypothetical protein [Bdellovibrionales bacterium]